MCERRVVCSSDGDENGDGDGDGDGEREVLGKDGRKGKIVLPLSSPSEFIPCQSFLRTVNVFLSFCISDNCSFD